LIAKLESGDPKSAWGFARLERRWLSGKSHAVRTASTGALRVGLQLVTDD